MTSSEGDDEGLPPYVCALLVHPTDPTKLLVELRPESAKVAGGTATCFGGKRERGEAPLDALLRECCEELAWSPSRENCQRAVSLLVDGRLIAWFFTATAPPDLASLTFEPGRRGTWLDVQAKCDDGTWSAEGLPLSPWHAAVLGAWLAGETQAEFRSDASSAPPDDGGARAAGGKEAGPPANGGRFASLGSRAREAAREHYFMLAVIVALGLASVPAVRPLGLVDGPLDPPRQLASRC